MWLLTEVRDDAASQVRVAPHHRQEGRQIALGGPLRTPSRRSATAGPAPASAAALARGLAWCTSVLPWRTCGTPAVGRSPWKQAMRRVERSLPSLRPAALLTIPGTG